MLREKIHAQDLYCVKINIVAGGFEPFVDGDILDSVKVNIAGEKSWSLVSPLPKPLGWLKGVTVMSRFYVTGQ